MSDRPVAINQLLTGSAATAIGVAIVRENESAHPDRLLVRPARRPQLRRDSSTVLVQPGLVG